jgi:hypothetical protein
MDMEAKWQCCKEGKEERRHKGKVAIGKVARRAKRKGGKKARSQLAKG